MSPQVWNQLTVQQQEKVFTVTKTRLDAKTTEVDALLVFRHFGPEGIARVFGDSDVSQRSLLNAAEQYLQAKYSQALLELEELQLTMKALEMMRSPIQRPGNISLR